MSGFVHVDQIRANRDALLDVIRSQHHVCEAARKSGVTLDEESQNKVLANCKAVAALDTALRALEEAGWGQPL